MMIRLLSLLILCSPSIALAEQRVFVCQTDYFAAVQGKFGEPKSGTQYKDFSFTINVSSSEVVLNLSPTLWKYKLKPKTVDLGSHGTNFSISDEIISAEYSMGQIVITTISINQGVLIAATCEKQ